MLIVCIHAFANSKNKANMHKESLHTLFKKIFTKRIQEWSKPRAHFQKCVLQDLYM